MSLDGSFSCDAALRRFLARCPSLRPQLRALEQKGGELTAEELVAAIAEPFLHPSYTIPIMGCFRPLCQRIVDSAVAKVRDASSLESESDEARGEEIGEDDLRVVDFYVGRERGLRLHELTSLALCRALDLAPFLLRCVLNYFKSSAPPFKRLISLQLASPITAKSQDASLLLDATRVPYRFLTMEPKVFSELWDWSCFIDLVQHIGDLGFVDATSVNDALDIRWCTVQILSVVLRISDRATESFGIGAEESFMCLIRWEEFCMDTSLEKAGWYLQASEAEHDGSSPAGSPTVSPRLESLESISIVDSSSNLPSMEFARRRCRSDVRHFVLTSTLRKSFEVALMAVSQKWPVLLHGPVGAGKTALINKLAEFSGSQVLFIHLDEHMDSRTLLGSYICTEQPGEFKWHPGSLTQAVMNGFWIVFENIDKAPSDIQSTLLPLLEGSNFFVTGHGEAVEVAESFRLFATITTLKHEVSHTLEGRISFSVLWRKLMVGNPSMEDMLDIVNTRHPRLQCISSRLIETFERVNSLVSHQLGGMPIDRTLSSGSSSRFSLRDLLKWCKRIAGLGVNFSSSQLSAEDCHNIYQEAVDIFAASSSSLDKRLTLKGEIARAFGYHSEAEAMHCTSKPIIQTRPSELQVGRVTLQHIQTKILKQKRPFVGTQNALNTLERVACSVKYNEPVLLVGETGTGKTTLIQNLAMWLGQPLTVMNLSQQSDVTDLLGGFKPVDARSICVPLYHEFKELFCKDFSRKKNELAIRYCEECIMKKEWKKLIGSLGKYVEKAQEKSRCGSKRKRPYSDWQSFSLRLEAARSQIGAACGMPFRFVEGAFITALRTGQWILLDEVNLAPPETLQRISAVLDGEDGTLCLAERGDVDYLERHPSFRMFACMNPATDAGKRELPFSFRSRFTEYFVDDVLDDKDLHLFVNQYMDDFHSTKETTDNIVRFYKAAKRKSEESLQDGANQKPQFSLRSLARALEYTKKAEKKFDFIKALYDGFCMFFLTLLDGPSANIMNNILNSLLLGGIVPPGLPFDAYFPERPEGQNISESVASLENYILTRSVKEHLNNLARAVYIKRYPVLLQGPTSSGKTSLVHYLASVTGHEFVRINNHEHTDLQEYFGSYITDSRGKLKFQEGVLVKAVREGHWIVLDELNLAPSDVLEALNRLLDDNRELFVPELQEKLPAHPDFMLFATQNPPMLYGGRKMLSRAFRNRFVEIHFHEIPEDELTTILQKRCKIPLSYAVKMVEVMKDLQLHRQNSRVFAGKHGFITPRDLFRWANRFKIFGKSYEDLAKDGYLLLAERLRDEDEKSVVQETLERRLHVKLNLDDLYKWQIDQSYTFFKLTEDPRVRECFGNITWTKSMLKLFLLVERCFKLREPVLLVGETGGGKTTVCQVLSIVLGATLHTLNCHQYTETSDFIGGFFPVRDRSRLAMEFKDYVTKTKASKIFLRIAGDAALSSDISNASCTIDQIDEILHTFEKGITFYSDITQQDVVELKQVKLDLMQLQEKWQTIFTWQDGPLVHAMKYGDLLLVDEISLADDSVLERLNSVLEPERKLTLSEKGGEVLEKITAHPNFFILATMNPGGDYGKKELSPALRNRFTEIWVPTVADINELKSIAIERFAKPEFSCYADSIVNFWQWFKQLQTCRTLTIRDLQSWISFVNVTEGSLGVRYALIHGLFLVLLDGLSLGTGISKGDADKLRESCLSFLLEEMQKVGSELFDSGLAEMENYGWGGKVKHTDIILCKDAHPAGYFGIGPFYIGKGNRDCKQEGYDFFAPTTGRNLMRVLRAMQVKDKKPVLLEGSPGVGKTSLIVALAGFSGHSVVRINLSEQTDMMDLLGSDLPVQGENGMEFSWSDGILLQALKSGSWVLLDELNLAPQSVLEGLNAILDHRAEVYIPELGVTFKCPDSFRVFACQNPSSQGGGRKGLPKSFLNRFTKVYVDELSPDDFLFICQSRFQSVPLVLLSKLISFNNLLYEDTMIHRKYGKEGSPWEFNLRDVFRSCQIIEGSPENSKVDCFLNTVYLQRMRTVADRHEVIKLYEAVFGVKPVLNQYPKLYINPEYLIVGSVSVKRNYFQPAKVWNTQLNILPGFFNSLEAVLHCLQQQWLCILVGPYSSGKTSLIRLLAQLTGNALNELNLSSGTDVSELLGCFEQYNFIRHYKAVVSQVERYVDEYFGLRLEVNWKRLIAERKSLFAKWFEFVAAKNYNYSASTFANTESSKNDTFSSLTLLIEIIEQLKHDLELLQLPVSWSQDDLIKSFKAVLDLQRNKSMQQPANFEWVAGDLIRAIECGEWVVLDNANLCNPTILDRINSLVEPDGSITINECGLVDGNPMVLHAHPNFRMFLTVDPKHGEVSRAMRNRGVEIFLMEQSWLVDGGREVCVDSEINDIKRFLALSGIPGNKLVLSMSEAHMYAKAAGLRLGIRITLLEVARWVQLFQQLLMKGNQPKWSLQLSWEHTYLPSLGESDGMSTIMEGKLRFLNNECFTSDMLSGCSLSLPGGWPVPHKLRNFVQYSKEACVKRNFLYLESLGAKFSSYELRKITIGTSLWSTSKKIHPLMMPIPLIHQHLFPELSGKQAVKSDDNHVKFDLALANKMLFIAANWAIEQATENDIGLYIIWFKWYGLLLQPYCQFFCSFSTILVEERGHPIWRCILECWRKVISHYKIDVNLHPLPLLSLELVDFIGSDNSLKACLKQLRNAIHSVGLLRSSYQQWNAERNYSYQENLQNIVPMLELLRNLEGKVLEGIVESRKLLQIYSELLEYHKMFWKNITSLDFEGAAVSWNFMKKEIVRLQPRFREAGLLLEKFTPNNFPTLSLHFGKPALWVYGGHPLLPSSADAFYKVQQLLTFINVVWSKTKFLKQNLGDDQCLVEAARSTNTDIRRLAMQGVCMSAFIATKSGPDDSDVVAHLEQLHQSLLRKVEAEEMNIKLLFRSATERNPLMSEITTCCTFSPEILCSRSGFHSWLANLPLLDLKSFNLDIMLLKEFANCTLVDSSDVYQVVSNRSNLLQYALDFSLNFSSRSPVEFKPHQMILWILDAWSSVNTVNTKVANCVVEMWYNYHSSLWTHCSGGLKSFLKISYDESCHLVYPTKTPVIANILQDSFCIKDFDVNCLKLRAASRNLWEDAPLQGNLIRCLHSAASSLFRQILSVHKKYFQGDLFMEMKSVLFRMSENGLKNEDLQILKSLINSTSHDMLRSVLDPLVETLLKELHFKFPSNESLYNLGCAWLHIGVLRFLLLFNSYSPDPTAKYSLKHSHILEKISLLQLEIKVRRECEQLAGSSSGAYNEKKILSLLLNLEEEERQLRTKVVFRPQPSKCNRLRSVCADFRFRELVSVLLMLDMDLKCNENLPLFVDRACSWQVSSANFIKRLSEEYSEYADLIQPIQVAVYEMKFGLSIAVSSAIERDYLNKVEEENIGRILDAIYSLMQFPAVSIDLHEIDSTFLVSDQNGFESTQVGQINLLKKLIAMSDETRSTDAHFPAQLITSIYHIMLMRTAHRVGSSLLMDKDSFSCLHNIFGHFTSLWVDMKSRRKVKEYDEGQYYKFRPRLIRIEDILEGDMSALLALDTDGNMTSETEERLGQEFMKMNTATKEYENVEEDWDLIPESILSSVVLIHNQLFGSSDLVEKPGVCHIADEHRLQSFMESYGLGATLIKDLQSYTSSMLDDHLMPEHLLRLCLDYEQTSGISCKLTNSYNIYKEPNASVMFKMVKPLTVLRDRVKNFLDEWSDHPILQNILEITESLLAFPLNSPLSKALLGLQLLIGRAQSLQENDSRYSFADQLQPIYMLVSSWQKLELDCWPSLLDCVQEKCDINAGKLWFPLRAVLHRICSGDPKEESLFTIKSIEEFIQTSSVGEFKRRLHLVIALYGELCSGTNLLAYSSSSRMKETLNILYNAFGYYIQFLPFVLKHIIDGRSLIEKDLREHLKLFSWEQLPHRSTSIEKFRRARQKMLKLVQKFNDILQQPVMVLVSQEVALTGSKILSWLDQKMSDEMRAEETQFSLALVNLRYDDRFLWYEEWRSKADSTLRSISYGDISGAGFFEGQGFLDVIRQSLYPESVQTDFRTEWEDYWTSLEKICRNAAELAHIWKHGTKNPKRRALANLFKTLEGCGLSKHRSVNNELEYSDKPSSSFLRPSYNVLHLLLQQCCDKSSQNTEIILPTQSNEPEDSKCREEWLSANWFYFKSLATMRQLQQLSLNFNKDLDLEQVNRAISFVDHLISILCEQREIAYSLSAHLKNLRKQYHLIYFAGRGNNSSLSPNQDALLKCMWQQKQLFDDLLAMLRDTSLLLGSIKNTHLSTCQVVKAEAAKISALIDKFVPRFTESKDSLDMYLIGCDRSLGASLEHLPLVVTKEMQQLVEVNWKTINYFGEDIQRLAFHDAPMKSITGILLTRFEVLINKGQVIIEDFHTEVKENNQHQQDSPPAEKPETLYAETFEKTKKVMVDVFGKLGVLSKGDGCAQELRSKNLPLWNDLLQSYMENLQIDNICTNIHTTAVMVRQLVDSSANKKPEACSLIETQLENFHALLNLLLTYAEHVLSEFLLAHRATAEMTHALVQVFALLLSEGFGSVEEPIETNSSGGTQDATGTGMGQGEGINDVSDLIDDESQLIGCPEKDGLDKSDQLPNGKDRGIEMDEDFSGDMFSVSEDSGDDVSGDEDDIKLESQMGEAGVDNQVVDEKAWDKDEEGDTQNSDEKYESGPSVKETDPGSREVRAKDDDALLAEETAEMDNDENDESTKVDNETTADEDQSTDDVGLDKSTAFEDPTGVKFCEEEKDFEDVNMDETEDFDMVDEADPDATGSDDEKMDEESIPPNHTDEENVMQIDEDNDTTNTGEGIEDTNMDSSKEKHESGNIGSFEHRRNSMPTTDRHGVDSNMEPEANWANSSDISSAAAPSINFSSEVPELEISLPASNGSRLSSNLSESQALQSDTSSLQIKQTNPLRSIGDAMEEWKERAKVSLDPEDLQAEALDGIDDKNVDEFRYVSEAEKGTSQALGAATSDQIRNNIDSNKPDTDDGHISRKEEVDKIDMTENTEGSLLKAIQPLNPRAEVDEEFLERTVDSGSSIEELQQNDFNNRSGDIVSFKRSFMDDKILPDDNLINNKELSRSLGIEISDVEKQQATLDWKTYELVTTRLSHELAEQLRLVMEPTLASKLQGDYRTGKRINMKKVIPYIASHFRKDKIWLRRTKPNKRDYQVVVAVDDSRSMSESHCGKIAVEALVTVCRAMSQLEVGQFAVASFGEKGKIKLLHDFDEPFTGEAGVKMISSLSFKQDNTIADEPVVDLLKYLNNLLDTAVANSRMPSGQNPLHQLILIIADGRFHEKENLRRCVRDLLNRKRMIAFILLDSPRESIMDLMEASFEGDKLSFTKYMNSFPFPYYIVLENIEALPRTLADLLRQWFELMQNLND
ncbi:midasin isoform X3 [Typha latifolia]|uniref:midasin isoform X3 n=1 Tax=Typha latifolia TaxID=4733 RepID=UPI003C2E0BC2